jgi:hypothetical protein
MSFQFHRSFFWLFVLLLATEILIALFVHDRLIRPYLGDVLVVPLVYSFFRSFLAVHPAGLALAVLVFAFLVEVLQAMHLAERLGLQHNRVAMTILGSSFSVADLLCYIAGFLICLKLK